MRERIRFSQATFYCAVVQSVLLFGSETWFLTSLTEKRLEGVHTGFLKLVTGNRERLHRDGYSRR